MLYNIKYKSKHKKPSLQIGDHVFYVIVSTSTLAGNFSIDSPIYFGDIQGITFDDYSEDYTLFVNCVTPNITIDPNMFLLFGKNQSANQSSLKGYYAEFKMVNNSSKRAELFSVSSEVNASSK
tara:strand:+ start:3589 stop:3957 length:369 start_codon:yes stop_codon:yes gene_type:complete